MFLSVIIPVYNVDKYIAKCINSVIAQNINEEIELILVDDGSKDSSGKICDDYASQYSWIKVFHIPNGGVGNARNYGLEHAHGEYFTFIDSDDFLDGGIYAHIYELHQQYNADAYVFGYKDYPQNKNSKGHIPKQRICTNTTTLAEAYLEMKKDYLIFPVTNKIFRKEVCKNIRFNTQVHYYEDYLFSLSCLNKINSLCTIEIAAYNYVHHEGEHLGGKYTEPDIIINVAKQIKSLSLSLPQNKNLTDYTILEYYNNLLHAIDSCLTLKDRIQHIKIFVSEIKQYGLLQELRKYLGRRKPLIIVPNVYGILFMLYIRKLIFKIKDYVS